MTSYEQLELIARSMWEQRQKFAAERGVALEDWGDGIIPVANGIMLEAFAALRAVHDSTPPPS